MDLLHSGVGERGDVRWSGRELCYVEQKSKLRMRPRFLTTGKDPVESFTTVKRKGKKEF